MVLIVFAFSNRSIVNVINLRLFYHEDQEGHEGVMKESCGRTTLHALHVLK